MRSRGFCQGAEFVYTGALADVTYMREMESWYGRYFQSNTDAVNNALRMKGLPAGEFRIVMVMVQGCLVHGFRTRAEQTALMQDMNASVVNKTLDVRPEWLQVWRM